MPPDDRFRLPSDEARNLAETFGTPLYVIDESHLRQRMRRYQAAFRAAYPKTELAFASKANSTLALLAIAHQEGYVIDVASEGELRAALHAGVPAKDCVLHGNDKRRSELAFALEVGVGLIVVDHLGELEMLAELWPTAPHHLQIVLRLAPGVDPVTHAKISTGQADTKFGFNISDGAARTAVQRTLDLGLPLIGFHCHVGSQLLDPEAQRAGGEQLAKFAVDMLEEFGFRAQRIIVGGGLGVRYVAEDAPMPVEQYCQLVVDAIREALGVSELAPTLGQEPGRSLVAESGVTLYEVGVVKTVPIPGGTRTYVSVDGGLADNPRPVMYEARYTVECVTQPADAPLQTVTVSGRHCETDLLFPDIQLPVAVAPGDLLQVLCTGAYNASMASNYNRFPRPATVLRRPDGSMTLIQRRDEWAEMFARELIPGDLH